MTLDYTKMFLIVTEEAVVKGHFALICTAPLGRFLLPGRRSGAQDLTRKNLPATGHAPRFVTTGQESPRSSSVNCSGVGFFIG